MPQNVVSIRDDSPAASGTSSLQAISEVQVTSSNIFVPPSQNLTARFVAVQPGRLGRFAQAQFSLNLAHLRNGNLQTPDLRYCSVVIGMLSVKCPNGSTVIKRNEQLSRRPPFVAGFLGLQRTTELVPICKRLALYILSFKAQMDNNFSSSGTELGAHSFAAVHIL